MGSRLDANSTAVRKRIENHTFSDEQGEEYEGSSFGGFPEYFRRKKIKLQNLDAQLRAEAADKPHLFRGIVAHVNGYTQPSLNDLHRLIVTHGGGFMQYLDGKTQVTHIIASSLTPKKAVDFKKYRIVKPAWIVDSVNAGKLLPWSNYRVIDEGAGQKVLQLDHGKVQSQVNRKAAGYRDQTEHSWYTRQLNEDGHQQLESLQRVPSPSSSPYDPDLDLIEDADVGTVPEGETSSAKLERGIDERSVMQHQNEQTARSRPGDRDVGPQMGANEGSQAQNDGRHTLVDFEPVAEQQASLRDHAVVLKEPLQESQGLPKEDSPSTNPFKRKADGRDQSPSTRAKMTAEQHNTELLSDPRIRKSSVLNPDFLEQYYRESRLHHLSTWKADLKSHFQAITAAQSSSQKAKQKRAPGSRRYILHIDFDSFFVAVSLKNHPQLVNKPAVVAHGSGSGSEIASCNYPARAYGVKNGMWMKRAQDMCPELNVLPYDFPAYEAASKIFYDAILETGGIVQSVSIDEALVDVTAFCLPEGGTDGLGVREGSIWREQAKADEMAQAVRDKVKAGTSCAVSVGVGGNILLAKVALRKAKPAGQHHIRPEDALEFLGSLEVSSLPGVAYSISGKLEELGIKYVKDIREVTKERLISTLGPKTGEKIWNYSRGIDRTEVGDQVIRKSVSAEVNWGVRFETQEQAEQFIDSLCGELNRRLLKEAVKGKQLTMKIMRRAQDAPRDPPKHLGHGKCDTYNKSVVLGVATNSNDVLTKEAISVLRSHKFSPGELRGLGVQMTKLEPIRVATALEGSRSSQKRLQFKAGPVNIPSEKPPVELDGEPLDGRARNGPQSKPEIPSEPDKRQPEPRLSSSQKRLQFKSGLTSNPKTPSEDPIQDDPETPHNQRSKDVLGHEAPHYIDSPTQKPLNTSGTQFVLPTQVDPKVVAELPPDIRSKLAKHIRAQPHETRQKPGNTTNSDSKVPSFTALPNQSQLDPSILEALPSDLRSEILAEYKDLPHLPHHSRGQSLLPQSPRRNRTVITRTNATSARGPSTRGRPRGSSLLARLRGASSRANTSTLTQSNFVATTNHARPGSRDQSEGEAELTTCELDQDFLAALPDDIRAEVIDSHKRDTLRRSGGIEVTRRQARRSHLRTQSRANQGGGAEGADTRVVTLAPRPQRPVFTVRKLHRLAELREAVSAWVEEFRDDGPYEEDVEALCKYLSAVIGEEGDLAKGAGVVRWVEWVIGEALGGDGMEEEARAKWVAALERAQRVVKDAVRTRGLGELDLDV